MQVPVAFSAISVDQEMYKNLIEDRAKQGLRVEGVPMQVTARKHTYIILTPLNPTFMK